MKTVARLVLARLFRWPSAKGWGLCGLLAILGLIVAGAAGAVGGFLSFRPLPLDLTVAKTAVLVFFIPALAEEVLFRGTLLPSGGDRRARIAVLASVAAFLAWHPLQAVTFGPPWRALFVDPWFLLATISLGIVAAMQTRLTNSLWPAILTHWLFVLTWNFVGGGPF